MTATLGPAPGFVKYSNYMIQISTSDAQWSAHVGGLVLANSHRALILEETGYERVVYFPREDVSISDLHMTVDKTTCPFKGEAQYFATSASKGGDSIAWSYPATYDEVAAVQGYIAFYPEKVMLQETPIALGDTQS